MNTTPKTKIVGTPKPIEVNQKLKIVAVLAANKKLDFDQLKGNLVLNLVATYTDAEAIIATQQAISGLNFKTEEWVIPFMNISANAEDMIDFSSFNKITQSKIISEKKEEKKEKTSEDMIAYVKYIFDKVGSEEDKKVSKKVINKFKQSL